jgi:hypothetical protein
MPVKITEFILEDAELDWLYGLGYEVLAHHARLGTVTSDWERFMTWRTIAQSLLRKALQNCYESRALTALRDGLKLEFSCGDIRNVWVECDRKAKALAKAQLRPWSPNRLPLIGSHCFARNFCSFFLAKSADKFFFAQLWK